MADISTSGKDEYRKVGRASSFSKFIGSPFRSPISKSKASSSSSNLFHRLNPARIFRKNSDKRSSESERGIKEAEEVAENLLNVASEVLHPIKEKTKEEEPTKTANRTSSSGTNDKKANLPSKLVELLAEKPKEELKAKTNETMEMIKDVVAIVQQDKLSSDGHHGRKSNDVVDENEKKKPIDGIEGKNITNQSSSMTVTIDEGSCKEGEKKKEENCVSSLAQGLHSICAPNNN